MAVASRNPAKLPFCQASILLYDRAVKFIPINHLVLETDMSLKCWPLEASQDSLASMNTFGPNTDKNACQPRVEQLQSGIVERS